PDGILDRARVVRAAIFHHRRLGGHGAPLGRHDPGRALPRRRAHLLAGPPLRPPGRRARGPARSPAPLSGSIATPLSGSAWSSRRANARSRVFPGSRAGTSLAGFGEAMTAMDGPPVVERLAFHSELGIEPLCAAIQR